MKGTGMYGGSFNPLHLGHVNNIIEASCMCNKLYVVLSVSLKEDEIDYKTRFKWLKNITKDMDNVEVISVFNNSKSKEDEDWEEVKESILSKINSTLDIVFCGNDYKKSKIFEKLYKGSEVYYFDRNEIDISSTQIRNNPYEYYDYLPDIVKEYYTKKVVVVGTESCGKSTLIRNLGLYYNTEYVEEIGRDVSVAKGGYENMQPEDYEEILFRHKVRELEALKKARKVLLVDTEALITLYYYNLSFDDIKHKRKFNDLADAVAALNKYDLWLFLKPDVEWVQDGTRTFGEYEVREENNKILKKMLNSHGVDYKTIKGNYHERYKSAKNYINELFK